MPAKHPLDVEITDLTDQASAAPDGQERAEAVEVCRGVQVKLDPVTAGRISADGEIVIEVFQRL